MSSQTNLRLETAVVQLGDNPCSTLASKLKERTSIVGVIGMGYVGLPLAITAAQIGLKVIGFDLDTTKVDSINRSISYIGDVSDASLAAVKNQFSATTNLAQLADCDVVVVAVPTPLTKNLSPDLSYIEGASHSIAEHLRPGQLITLESTTYPGTTEEVMLPILEATGLQVERDFYLAHSPERVDPGNKTHHTKNTPKVVGGVGPLSLEMATEFYSLFIDRVVPMSSAKAAELVKVYENVFRAVNVGLVNELALLCDVMGLNVWEVLDAAYTKPFGIMPFYPGPGVGGHCIPLDPHYLEHKAREYNFPTQFISLAGTINRRMPEFVVCKAQRVLNSLRKSVAGSKILILGVAYKANINDYRESPAIEIVRLLRGLEADVEYCDPYCDQFSEHGIEMRAADLTPSRLQAADLVILVTNHGDFDLESIARESRAVLDTRNAFAKAGINDPKVHLI